MPETASALKANLHGLKMKGRNGVITVQPQVKSMLMQTLEEVFSLLRREGLQINFDKLLRMNIGVSSRDFEHEISVLEKPG